MSIKFRMEGLTLSVESIERSVAYYERLGFKVAMNAAPHFALMKLEGSSIGLLAWEEALKDGGEKMSFSQARAIHVELSTDDLDGLYTDLVAKGIAFSEPPHDEPWERAMTALDPDGYSVEFAQGRRGENATK